MTLALILIACVMLGSAAVAVTLRNLIHSALLLVFTWASIGAFYLWAGAQFIAFAQILIYVGAVSMIVLFAMLLTRQGQGTELPIGSASIMRALSALLAGGGVAGVLIGAILGSPLDVATSAPAAISVKQLGEQLMGPHAAALLVVGIILTVALIGAVLLAAVDPKEQPEDIT